MDKPLDTDSSARPWPLDDSGGNSSGLIRYIMSVFQKLEKYSSFIVRTILAGVILTAFGCVYFMWAGVGGEMSQQMAKDQILQLTDGCTDGGQAIGVSYSAWPGEYDAWYKIALTAPELECIKSKGSFNLIAELNNDIYRGVISAPPLWFKPKAKYASIHIKGKGACIWSSYNENGNGQEFFISRHSTHDDCINQGFGNPIPAT